MSLSEILPDIKRKLHELEVKVVELERTSSSSSTSSYAASDLYVSLNEITLQIDMTESLINNEPRLKRDDYRRRILHLKNSNQHIKTSVDNIIKRRSSNHNYYMNNRQELLGHSYQAYDVENGSNVTSLLKESESINNSKSMINNYLSIGQETLSELMSQKDRLKGVHRKVIDMINYLGLSNTLLKSVEKRESFDKWIVYIGMSFILILLLVIYLFVKRR